MYGYIAFLRAINIGKRTVKMDHLRSIFAALGYADVATFIASGNVFFRTDAADPVVLERQIEQHLLRSLGFPVETLLRSLREVSAVAQYSPFPGVDAAAEEAGLYVGFLRSPPAPALRREVAGKSNEVDQLKVHGRELYWLARRKFGGSTVTGAALEKALGMSMTLRNTTTVQRLAAKYPASG